VDFHRLALSDDRKAANDRTQNRMAMGDGELLTLSVALEPPAEPPLPNPGNDDPLGEPDDVFGDATTKSESDDGSNLPDPPDDFPLPEPCDGIPGDGCYPIQLP
jgi:hypothetical protein